MAKKQLKYTDPNQKMGRPKKYKDNPEVPEHLRKLVYLYKKENPLSKKLTISEMVRYNERKHQEDPESFPLYPRDVWSDYGREFIDAANSPIPYSYKPNSNTAFVVPNVAEIVEKFYDDKEKMLTLLLSLEKQLHDSLLREQEAYSKIAGLEQEIVQYKEKLKQKDEVIGLYERFSLEMAHHSYVDAFQEKYGLKNQISVNANARNKYAMRNLDNLESLFPYNNNQEESKQDSETLAPKETKLLKSWREKRNQQNN